MQQHYSPSFQAYIKNKYTLLGEKKSQKKIDNFQSKISIKVMYICIAMYQQREMLVHS